MGAENTKEQDFQTEIQELLASARGMAEGNFHRTVNIKARGIIGEVAAYINQTLHNLQRLDPTVKDSQREIPKVAKDLAEIIHTTEEATNRVLEQTEYLVDEQQQVEQKLSRVTEMLRHFPKDPRITDSLGSLEETKEIHRRSQGRAMDIMAAMEFQDLTTQKIQRLIGLIAEVEARLLRLLVMFRIEETGAQGGATDPIVDSCVKDESAFCDQDLVDQLLKQFQAAR